MKVYYEDQSYTIDFPNDTKFFKLTRKYYPNKLFKIGKKFVSIRYLKAVGEVRAYKKNKHHIKNKCRGGQTLDSNLISMDISRHNAYHLLFGNLSFKEASELLLRADKTKKNKHF